MSDYPYYSILGDAPLESDEYSIESVRYADAEPIRKWRNEQISALRQSTELSSDEQILYFQQVIEKDFPEDQPDKILVRFCHKDELIGYGGIVHLDWVNLRGEVSFLLNTTHTQNLEKYSIELGIFFRLIKKLGFLKLGLNKLSTEAFAHRDYHVLAIENSGFQREGILREHTMINGAWVDAVVASCLHSDYIDSEDL